MPPAAGNKKKGNISDDGRRVIHHETVACSILQKIKTVGHGKWKLVRAGERLHIVTSFV